MGRYLGIDDVPRHVHLRAVPTFPAPHLYDHEVEEMTPLLVQTALSVVVSHAARADDDQLREAARVVRAAMRQRADDDWADPRGMARLPEVTP